jgi:general secretion pathway protein A
MPNALPDVSPKMAATVTSVPAATRLAEFFSDSSRGTLSSSFSDLFSCWRIKSSLNPGELGCKAAQAQGLDCLFLAGSWPKLRRYNLPAILELVLPSGLRKSATLAGLTSDTATLLSGGREHTVPLVELERAWDGSFIALWRPPFAARQLVPGARGEEVAWVRRALDILDKKTPPAEVSDLYDEELRQRILVFQRDRSLIQDGLVGNETLVRLTLAVQGPNAPSLSRDSR